MQKTRLNASAETGAERSGDAGARRVGRPSRYPDARGAIMRAALDLFSERGFEASSIADIAARAGLPKPNVLYYFASKDELWREVVDQQWREIDAHFVARGGPGLPATRSGLAERIRIFMDACRAFPAYTRIPAIEGNADTWRTRYLAEKHLGRHVKAVRRYYRQLISNRVVPETDPLVLQILLGASGHLYFGQQALWRLVDSSGRSDVQAAQHFADALIALLCGPGPTSDSAEPVDN